MDSQNPYNILGVSEDAAAADIRRAYRALALRWHPDKNPQEEKARANRLFLEIGLAYEVLRDPSRRSEYDRRRCFTARRHSSCQPPRQGPRARRQSWSSASGGRPRQTHSGAFYRPRATEAPPGGDADAEPGGPTCDGHAETGRPDFHGQIAAPTLRHPPSSRIWFARSSACATRAYRGQEAQDLAQGRHMALQLAAAWLKGHNGTLLEIRGCFQKGEVPVQQSEALAVARAKSAAGFLSSKCDVPAERCHASERLGQSFQGIELRGMAQVEGLDMSFKDAGAVELKCVAPLAALAAMLRGSPACAVLIEVCCAEDQQLAKHRAAALRRSLAQHGVRPAQISVRTREAARSEVKFFVGLEQLQQEEAR